MPTTARIRKSIPEYLRENGEAGPIAGVIQSEKRRALRHTGFHQYFTTRAFNVVQLYLKRYSTAGDCVLDPFAGSGVTATEAIILRRRAVSCDLNPLSTLITRAKVLPMDTEWAEAQFESMRKDLAMICAEVDEWSDEQVLAELEQYWYPTDEIPPYVDQDNTGTVDQLFFPRQLLCHAMILNWIHQNLPLRTEKLLFLVAFSANLFRANRTYAHPSETTKWSGQSRIFQYYKFSIPRDPTYLNAWEAFERRFNRVLSGKREAMEEIGESFDSTSLTVRTGHATDILRKMRNESVEYIFTDPPYLDNMAYLDLSVIAAAWLNMQLPREEAQKELIEAGSIGKTREQYLEDLVQAIAEMARVLKTGHYMSIVYSTQDPSVWNALIAAARNSNAEVHTVDILGSSLKSVRKVESPATVLSGGLVVNFEKVARVQRRVTTDLPNIPVFLANEAKRLVIQFMGATTDEIFYGAYAKLLQEGLLGQTNRDRVYSVFGSLAEFLERDLFLDDAGFWQLRPDSAIPHSIPHNHVIRYFVFLKLYLDGPSTLEEVVEFSLSRVARHRYESLEAGRIADMIQEIAVREDGLWKLDDGVMIQLQIPLTPSDAWLRHWKDELQSDYLNRLACWRNSPLFSYPTWDLGSTDSTQIKSVLYGRDDRPEEG